MTRPAWLGAWPIAYPHVRRRWTVRADAAWGLLDPADGVVAPVEPAADRRLPGLAEALESGHLVGYRAERRAIVRSDLGYVKVVRPSRVDQVVRAHRRVADAKIPIAVPKVMRFSDDGRIQLETLPGPSLHELIRSQRTPELALPVEQVADALLSLHLVEPTGCAPPGDPSHPWATMVGRAEPDATEELLRLVERLPSLPPGVPALVHGDLHDKNIIVSGRTIGLIDLDGVRAGIAEDELANLGVHLQLRCLQSRRPITTGRALANRLYKQYGDRRTISRPRIDAVERHTWFRLACLYRFRAASRPLVPRLLQLAVDG